MSKNNNREYNWHLWQFKALLPVNTCSLWNTPPEGNHTLASHCFICLLIRAKRFNNTTQELLHNTRSEGRREGRREGACMPTHWKVFQKRRWCIGAFTRTGESDCEATSVDFHHFQYSHKVKTIPIKTTITSGQAMNQLNSVKMNPSSQSVNQSINHSI